MRFGPVFFAATALAVLLEVPSAGATDIETIQQIIGTYAGAALDQGTTPGIGVGVIYGKVPFQFWAHGAAIAGTRTAFTTDSDFQIASITKVFTTALLGEADPSILTKSLSEFQPALGTLDNAGPVTLLQLADFTSGFPRLPPLCDAAGAPAGCRINSRPTLQEYGIADFVAFFRGAKPKNCTKSPQPACPAAPYEYSNISIGLLGLLLATPSGQPFAADPVTPWYRMVKSRILTPLALDHTHLTGSPIPLGGQAADGYSLARAQAVAGEHKIKSIKVLNGGMSFVTVPAVTIAGGGGHGATATAEIGAASVTGITVTKAGKGYTSAPTIGLSGGNPTEAAQAYAILDGGRIKQIVLTSAGIDYKRAPSVTISGGGGSGAAATAEIGDRRVTAITVTDGGSDYSAPAQIGFEAAGVAKPATAQAITSNGAITAIEVIGGGAGYQTAPAVTITSFPGGGSGATAIARIANGEIVSVQVTNGGSGYPPPLTVEVAAGKPRSNPVPIWAPAGALSSTLYDMTSFAAAAIGHPIVKGHQVPSELTQGFLVAEKPYACIAPDPALASCLPESNRSGLAWTIHPASGDIPAIIEKNGTLDGYSSQIVLAPGRGLAVVVFANSETQGPAVPVAFNIAYQILATLPP